MKKFFTVICLIFFFSLLNLLYITNKDSVYLEETYDPATSPKKEVTPFAITTEKIPEGLIWQTGAGQESFASPKAKKGGTQNDILGSFPPNFRQVGPDSNSGFRGHLDVNDMSLVDKHPETDALIPSLAKAWAIGDDMRTVYYKLDPDARWSDGVPVTADDYIFRLKAMRAPSIIAPWYNQYYLSEYENILKFDDHTIAIRRFKPKADLVLTSGVPPLPYHFYGNLRTIKKKYTLTKAAKYLAVDNKEFTPEQKAIKAAFDKEVAAYEAAENKEELTKPNEPKIEIEVEDVEDNWVKKYDWQIQPRTGPYNIHTYIKGKEVTFARNKNWWAKDKKFYKNRYNVDFVRYTVIRDAHVAYEHFLKARLDNFGLVLPVFWHSKAKYLDQVDKGYMTKVWYFNDAPQSSYQISFNTSHELLKNRDLRIAIMHSLNLQEMIDTVLRSDYMLANTFHEGFGAYTNPNVKARRFNPELADKHFAKAGFAKIGDDGIRVNAAGERLSFKILYASATHTERLLVIKNEAAKLGLELKLDQFDPTAVFKAMLDKKHAIAWHGWMPQMRPSYRGSFHKENANKPKNNNLSNLDDDAVSELIDNYRAAINGNEKAKLAHQIEERLFELAPAMPTYKVPYFREAVWRWVKYPDFVATRLSSISVTDFGLHWIDEEVKKETLKAMKEDRILYDTPKLIKVTRENGQVIKTVQ